MPKRNMDAELYAHDPDLARELADAVAVEKAVDKRVNVLKERVDRLEEWRVVSVRERFERLEALLHAVGIVLVEACEKK